MKSILFLLAGLLIIQPLYSQAVKPEKINIKGRHNLYANYGYSDFRESNIYVGKWNAKSTGFGYLYSVNEEFNLGILGVYTSYLTDEHKYVDVSWPGTQYESVYKYRSHSYSILVQCQFVWLNTTYIGLYSGVTFGPEFYQPVTRERISGNGWTPWYHGMFEASSQSILSLSIIGVKLRSADLMRWYFTAEPYLPIQNREKPIQDMGLLFGLGYRF